MAVSIITDIMVVRSCRNDVFGARDAGCYAWLWGVDVRSFAEVARRVLHRGDAED